MRWNCMYLFGGTVVGKLKCSKVLGSLGSIEFLRAFLWGMGRRLECRGGGGDWAISKRGIFYFSLKQKNSL